MKKAIWALALAVVVTASGCGRSHRHNNVVSSDPKNPNPQLTVTQDTMSGDLSVDLANKPSDGNQAVVLVIKGNLVGQGNTFTVILPGVSTTVAQLPSVLDYDNLNLERFDQLEISGTLNGTPLTSIRFGIGSSVVTFDFTQITPGANGETEWSLTRTASGTSAVKVKVYTTDVNGNVLSSFEDNRDFNSGTTNGVSGGQLRTIKHATDVNFIVELTGPEIVGTETYTVTVNGGSGLTDRSERVHFKLN
jgi:hypothetical protein